jgi:hypothetical protein
VTTVDARLARLEEQIKGVREDVAEMHGEIERGRTRLHSLEGFAQAYLEAQKINRRREEAQYRKLGRWVGVGTVLLTFGMLVLSAVTLIVHT